MINRERKKERKSIFNIVVKEGIVRSTRFESKQADIFTRTFRVLSGEFCVSSKIQYMTCHNVSLIATNRSPDCMILTQVKMVK